MLIGDGGPQLQALFIMFSVCLLRCANVTCLLAICTLVLYSVPSDTYKREEKKMLMQGKKTLVTEGVTVLIGYRDIYIGIFTYGLSSLSVGSWLRRSPKSNGTELGRYLNDRPLSELWLVATSEREAVFFLRPPWCLHLRGGSVPILYLKILSNFSGERFDRTKRKKRRRKKHGCTRNRDAYTEKNISEFFLFFIGILPQGVENWKIYYLKGSIYYCESEITG